MLYDATPRQCWGLGARRKYTQCTIHAKTKRHLFARIVFVYIIMGCSNGIEGEPCCTISAPYSAACLS